MNGYLERFEQELKQKAPLQPGAGDGPSSVNAPKVRERVNAFVQAAMPAVQAATPEKILMGKMCGRSFGVQSLR
ncbi:hypothetical protein GHT07_01885 [Caenimonas koreensis DSM 17982]|uniref:Uncharacterized protein n=1 Tax=Caenimonas koreensis DSM 17982 TaxID=1121255 RepID=A0A844AYY8_9BURK|nr:hypothetical protein [Caenimonas koreensis]MRD46013.1 hypothetical protein [Caenimonas koreensis DSM 17982]